MKSTEGARYVEHKEVEVARLVPNPLQPATRATEIAVEALKEQYEKTLFLAEIIVTPLRRHPGDFMVCDGHRRLRVAEMAGRAHVQVGVLDGDPQELFVRLNGGIRNVKGGDWCAVWAVAEDPAHILSIIRATHRHKIEELVNIFGESRAREIGQLGKSAEIVVQINSVAKMLAHYEAQLKDHPTRRQTGEWMLKWQAQRWVREHQEYRIATARHIASCIVSDSHPGGKKKQADVQKRQLRTVK